MQTEVGGTYRIALNLSNAEQVGPTWLVGAFASAFPDSQIISLDEYGAHRAVVNVRWTRSPGEIAEGTQIKGMAQGLVLPAEAVPLGIVVSVEKTGSGQPDLEARIPNSVKLLVAGGLLLTTWYFAVRIEEKHGKS
jgi:hypothetical protein